MRLRQLTAIVGTLGPAATKAVKQRRHCHPSESVADKSTKLAVQAIASCRVERGNRADGEAKRCSLVALQTTSEAESLVQHRLLVLTAWSTWLCAVIRLGAAVEQSSACARDSSSGRQANRPVAAAVVAMLAMRSSSAWRMVAIAAIMLIAHAGERGKRRAEEERALLLPPSDHGPIRLLISPRFACSPCIQPCA